MTAWWEGLADAAAQVECAGATHTLRWHAGTLITCDHGDPGDEAALAALAGEPRPCLEIVKAWQRRQDDPRVLTYGSRGPTDPIDPEGAMPHRRGRSGQGGMYFVGRPAVAVGSAVGGTVVTSTSPTGIATPDDRDELSSLLGLGGGLPDRLQAHVAAAWADRLAGGHPELEDARPQLHAALYGRLLATLRGWLGEPELEIALTMTDAGDARRLARTEDGIEVALPFAWLSEVWVRGLSVIAGRLCLAATAVDESRWSLHTLGPDLTDTAPLTLGFEK